MAINFDNCLKNYVYEPTDLCSIYDPVDTPPPDEFWKNWRSPFHTVIWQNIGNTWYIIKTEFGGNEALTDKVKRLIFSEKGTVS